MLRHFDSGVILDGYRIGDSIAVDIPITLDFSPEAQNKVFQDVILGRYPELKKDIYTITSIAFEYDAYVVKDDKIYLLTKSK